MARATTQLGTDGRGGQGASNLALATANVFGVGPAFSLVYSAGANKSECMHAHCAVVQYSFLGFQACQGSDLSSM